MSEIVWDEKIKLVIYFLRQRRRKMLFVEDLFPKLAEEISDFVNKNKIAA